MFSESQNIEYKESWRDEYLKWVCGFANAHGGRIYIGVDDNKRIVGLSDAKRLMEDIPNKIVNYWGLVEDVNLLVADKLEYIEIVVAPSNIPITYKGQYHYRSGTTKQELKGMALQQFIMRKMGRSWDDMAVEKASLEDIDRKAIDYFIRKGITLKRIDSDESESSTLNVLDNLNLIDEEGRLRAAAILLFGKRPQRFFSGVEFKIGRFGRNESDLLFQDTIEGNIIEMADKVMEVLKGKYLISPIHYEGMQRIEPLEIPETALRKIIYNAITHKDYAGAPIQMQVYDNYLEIWNEGGLPEGYTPETLMRKHSSRPRNKKIAYAMFKAGFIESWGRGYKKIMEELEKANYPLPVIQEIDGGVSVRIKRLPMEELVPKTMAENNCTGNDVGNDVGNMSVMKLSERQSKIYSLITENPHITVKEMSVFLSVNKRTVERDLAAMTDVVRYEGKTMAGKWIIVKEN